MVIVKKLDINFKNATTIKARIAKIDEIITELLETAMRSVANGDTLEYTLDDGQTTTKQTYTSTQSITNTVRQYENLRAMYVQMLAPRQVKLIDRKSMIYYGC